MEARSYNVFTFEELQEDIQEKAIDKLRDINVDDSYWYEYIIDQFHDDLLEEGIYDVDTKKIYFSGFGYQGQGACFTGRLDTSKARAWIEKNMPTDKEYHRILIYLFENNFLTAWTQGNDRYYSQSSDIEFDNPHYEYVSWITPRDEKGYLQWSKGYPVGSQAEAYKRTEKAVEAFTSAWEEYCSDKAHELFKSLREEYEYQTGDDAIKETILANEYMFTEEGDID